MALVNYTITRITEGQPATPDSVNNPISELEANDRGLDTRLTARESEINTARGGESSLGNRLDSLAADIAGLDPDMQNALLGALSHAVESAGLANREIERLRSVQIQEGEVVIRNRGVLSGCAAGASSDATRNLNISAGRFFMHGRTFGLQQLSNTASVPGNSGGSSAVCKVYLWIDGTAVHCDCTELGEPVPADGLEVASIEVPSGNTEVTDPYLDSIVITDTRRLEPSWPIVQVDPAMEAVAIPHALPDAGYRVAIDVVDSEGGPGRSCHVSALDRLANGFKLYLGGEADSVNVRWTVHRLSK
jgi:hypothetical protein